MQKLLSTITLSVSLLISSSSLTYAATISPDIQAIHDRMEAQKQELLSRFSLPSPTPKLSSTPTPTIKPTPTPKPTTTPTPKPSASPTPTTDNREQATVQQYLLDQINAYRKTQGLSTVQMDSYTCNFAKTRAQEISSAFNHDGFRNRIKSRTLPYPSYRRVTENIAMTSNYKQVVQMWINSSGHASNMRQDTPYVCVEKYGNYYAYEGWRP